MPRLDYVQEELSLSFQFVFTLAVNHELYFKIFFLFFFFGKCLYFGSLCLENFMCNVTHRCLFRVLLGFYSISLLLTQGFLPWIGPGLRRPQLLYFRLQLNTVFIYWTLYEGFLSYVLGKIMQGMTKNDYKITMITSRSVWAMILSCILNTR